MEISCSICHEALGLIKPSGATKCGHLYHLSCLFDWLARSTTCPTCRASCTLPTVTRIFFSITTAGVAKEKMPLPLDTSYFLKSNYDRLERKSQRLKFQLKRLANRKNQKIKWVSVCTLASFDNSWFTNPFIDPWRWNWGESPAMGTTATTDQGGHSEILDITRIK